MAYKSRERNDNASPTRPRALMITQPTTKLQTTGRPTLSPTPTTLGRTEDDHLSRHTCKDSHLRLRRFGRLCACHGLVRVRSRDTYTYDNASRLKVASIAQRHLSHAGLRCGLAVDLREGIQGQPHAESIRRHACSPTRSSATMPTGGSPTSSSTPSLPEVTLRRTTSSTMTTTNSRHGTATASP